MNVLDAIANPEDAAAVRQLGSQLLTPLLDQDRDGSIMDDVSSMIGRFMKRP